MRRILAIAALATCMCATASRVDAQRTNVSALDSARAAAPKKEKDPTSATLLGFLPGVGHLYAEELNRGWLIILLYGVGAGISMNGRTDTVGKVGGALAIGGFLFSVIDAGKAARRYNARLAKERASVPGDTLRSPAAFARTRRDVRRMLPDELVPDR